VETVIVTHGPGQFTGEANLITGRRSLARLRVTEDGEVVELDRSGLLTLIQTDAELSAILMRAFILRRADLIAGGYGAVTVVDSTHSAGTLRVRKFLTRNGHPLRVVMDPANKRRHVRESLFDAMSGACLFFHSILAR
jgi:thioredoxin reductase (NADPH)